MGSASVKAQAKSLRCATFAESSRIARRRCVAVRGHACVPFSLRIQYSLVQIRRDPHSAKARRYCGGTVSGPWSSMPMICFADTKASISQMEFLSPKYWPLRYRSGRHLSDS